MNTIGETLLEMLVIFSVYIFNYWKFAYFMGSFGALLRAQPNSSNVVHYKVTLILYINIYFLLIYIFFFNWLPHGELSGTIMKRCLFSLGWPIKIPYGVDVLLRRPASHPIFPIGLVKTETNFIVRSAETDLGRWLLMVPVIKVDAYPFLAF